MYAARTLFIDRLRAGLTALVITHHTAITYGGSGGWFYREITDGGRPSSILLTLLCSVDQAFFMGMFFLIAGYFAPAALGRKGPGRFVRERLVRLGLPLLIFGFLLGPLTAALAATARGKAFADTWMQLVAGGRFISGPLWFAQALLLFAVAHGVVSWLQPRHALDQDRRAARDQAWLLSALGVGICALLLRQWVPVGQEWFGLQIGHFASYVFLYVLGAAAWPHRWLERVEEAQARRWRRVALVAFPVLPLVGIAAGALQGKAVDASTGWSPLAVVYAFWEPFVAWGVIAMLLWRGREHWNQPSARWQRWGERAYGAFIVHAPVIVALALVLRPWGAPALVKFALVAALGIALSFAIAGLLLRLPGARRVL